MRTARVHRHANRFCKARVERIPDIEPEIRPNWRRCARTWSACSSRSWPHRPISPRTWPSTGGADHRAGPPGRFRGGQPAVAEPRRAPAPAGTARWRRARLNEIHRHLTRELELLELRSRIQSQVQGQLSQSQREFYLREQLKAIQKELGEGDDATRDTEDLRKKLEAAGMPEEVKTEAMRELNRLSRMSPASPEYGVTRTYLEWMASLPWSIVFGFAGGREARGGDPGRGSLRPGEGEGPHSGLPGRAAVAARAQRADPVLRGTARSGQDLAGPLDRARPGAEVRAHLDGRHARRGRNSRPPAHLHRRTARPDHPGACAAPAPTIRCSCWTRWTNWAAIFAATRHRRCSKCSIRNRTPPSATITWTCRSIFRKVLFITTANVLDPIPDALRDRMEIIPLEGYTEQEKVIIAFRYLIPRQMRGERAGPGRRHSLHRRCGTLPDPALHARGRRAQPGARDRHDLPQAGAPYRRREIASMRGSDSGAGGDATWARRDSAPTPKSPSARGGRASRWGWRGHRWAATCCSSRRAACRAATRA